MTREWFRDDLRIHGHEGYVQADRFGVCSTCRWMGPDRATLEEAAEDVRQHIAGTGWAFDEVLANGRREA